jgi:hypothetical protein
MARFMDLDLVRYAVDTADQRGTTIDEALQHWQLAGAAEGGIASAHWVSIAFGLAREKRAREQGA